MLIYDTPRRLVEESFFSPTIGLIRFYAKVWTAAKRPGRMYDPSLDFVPMSQWREIHILVRVLSVAHIWKRTYVAAVDMSADAAVSNEACQRSDTTYLLRCHQTQSE